MAERDLHPVAVLSGNRNFPGRAHPDLDAGFLASPPLVIAYALAGAVTGDILGGAGEPDARWAARFLRDLWPEAGEIDAAMARLRPNEVPAAYAESEASPAWAALDAPSGALFPWDPASTYVRRPPFARFDEPARLGTYEPHPILMLGDDMTTDHISPAGAIRAGAAADYLIARGEDPRDLNVYAARRGNWEVMVRGLFTNRNARSLLDPALRPGETRHVPSGAALPLWDAAERLSRRRHPGGYRRRRALRHGLIARLGSQGRRSARHAGGTGLEHRAYPSLQISSAWACCPCAFRQRPGRCCTVSLPGDRIMVHAEPELRFPPEGVRGSACFASAGGRMSSTPRRWSRPRSSSRC